MEKKTSSAKAITAIITGFATIAATVFAVEMEWFTPELAVTMGVAFSSLLVYLVPNKEVK